MTDKYITSSQYREGLNSIKEYIDKSIPHIGYPVIFTLSADKVLEIYNSTNHEMEFDKPSSIDLNKEIIMTYNNEDIISENSLDNYIRYKNNNIAISFHIGYDINKNTNENKMVITIVELNTNITSDLILKQREDKYLNNKYLKKDVAIQNSITIGTRIISSIGQYSFSNGKETTASGDYSHAEGENTQAVNANCHAEGFYSCASGESSHAEGYWSSASGSYSHAEGIETTASGKYSHAEGNSTKASGESSHAEGNRTDASGVYSHAEGMNTEALGAGSHAEGWATTASSYYSHAEGYFTKASSKAQHVQGKYNIEDTKNKYAHIVGNGTDDTVRSNAHTLDWNGNAWFAGDVQANNIPHVISEKVVLTVPAATITEKKTEIDKATQENPAQINVNGTVTYDSTKLYYLKYNNKEYFAAYSTDKFTSYGDDCLCGIGTQKGNTILMIASLDTTNITDLQLIEKDIKKLGNMYIPNDLNVNNSITVGIRTGKIGNFSSSFGFMSESSGNYSHVEGLYNNASSECSHAEGYGTTASGYRSHAEGNNTTASGSTSHAEGSSSSSSAYCSHAEGSYTTASGAQSHAEGSHTTASGTNSHTEGYETIASGQHQHVQGKHNIEDTEDKYAHIVGNGTDNNKSNAHTLDWNGNAWYAGKLSQEGTPTEDKDLSTKKYVDDNTPIKSLPVNSTTKTGAVVEVNNITVSGCYALPKRLDGTHWTNLIMKAMINDGSGKGKSVMLSGYQNHVFYVNIESKKIYCDNLRIVYNIGTTDDTTYIRTEPYYLPTTNTKEFTPTSDYNPATKKYVDDVKSSIVVPAKTSELTNDSGFLTSIPEEYVTETKLTSKGYLTEHQSLDGYAKTEYVDSKTTLEETIFEGVASDTLNDYWTHCSLLDGEGCWVIDKEVIIGENIENPYYIEINGTDIYSPENSTYDATNKAWLYDHTMDNGNKLFICANYENQNKMVVPWDGMGNYNKLKIFTRTELGKKIEEQQQHSINKLATKEKPVFIGNISMGRKKGSTIGGYSVAIGYDITASGYASHAEGDNTVASGNQSHAEGERTTASGYNSHAEGYKTIASNTLSHAQGNSTTASGNCSHAEGYYTTASGDYSHAEGYNTISSSENQHVQGKYNIEDKDNKYAHIVGNGSNNSTSNAHTLDWNGNAWYAGQVEGINLPYNISSKILATIPANNVKLNDTITVNNASINKDRRYYIEFLGIKKLCSLSIGEIDGNVIICSINNYTIQAYNDSSNMTIYISNNSPTEELNSMNDEIDTYDLPVDEIIPNATDLIIHEEENKYLDSKYLETDLILQNSISLGRIGNIGYGSSAIGIGVEASGSSSHAEGDTTIASGDDSHAEGSNTIASGDKSHAEGNKTNASGNNSHAEGDNTTASGLMSHAEGSSTESSGYCSHSEGFMTIASNTQSHAEGNRTNASGTNSHAEGDNTTASGSCSHVEGQYTKASSTNQHVQGKYNIEDTANKYAHIVGNGNKNNARSNAHTLDWDGNAWFAGKVTQEGTPTDDKDLVNKKYVDDKISNIPDAYTLLYPKEVDRTIAYYDIYDLPLGDYRIAQQDGIRTWNICVYVNNIRTQLFSTQNSRGFSFSKRINGTGTADGKSGKLITIDTYSMTTGGETYTWMVYDDGSVDVKNHKATILSAYTNTEFTPTKDYQPATKKYVDDAKASIVVPTKTSELTNDSNFLTEHQSLTKYATIDYVDSKLTTNYVSKEELTESTKPADTSTVKTTLNNILGGDYIE